MMKLVIAALAAVTLCVSDAASQSLVQRSDWQNRKFETYLPKPAATVPWLEIDTKTRLPKGEIPLGRDVASVGPFVLLPVDADIRISTNVTPAFRSM
jgi:hypothetical protein